MSETVKKPTYLVLLGAPGAGKGTQAALLVEKLGMVHVSSGDLFRENLNQGTPLGLVARSYMDQGQLVPDNITIAMVMDRLEQPDCARGVILDGFPRTLAQAQALDEALNARGSRISVVPYVRVSTDLLLRRLTGRWTCKQCKTVYHELYSPSKVAGVCDVCGGDLYQRPDDAPETQKNRVDVYTSQTEPLIQYYRSKGLLVEVDGEGDVESVHSTLLHVVQEVE